MSVVSILQGLYQQTGSKYISIPASAFTAEFGSGPVQDAIAQLLSGQLQLGSATDNITFTVDVADDKVTIVGNGSLAPLDSISVTVVFQGQDGGVSMNLNATVTSNWTLSQAWPSQLDEFPFNALTITGGTLTLNVAPGASDVRLTASVSSTFSGQSLSNTAADGLFVVDYKNSALTFAAGFLITGTWSPFSSPGLNLPTRFQNVFNASFELGLFFATLEVDDLSAFDNLKGSGKLFFLPDKIESGLTFLAGMQLAGDAAVLGTLFTGQPTLEFTAFKGGDELDLSAKLEDVTIGTFTFQSVELDWKSSGSDSGEIDLKLVTVVNDAAANMNDLGVCGTGSLQYGTSDSANFTLEVGQCGDGTNGWADPFGIPNLTIDDFAVTFKLVAEPEEVAVDLGGKFTLGTTQPKPVVVTVAAGIALDADLPAPDGLVFEISGTSPGTEVSLSNVIDDVASVFGKSFPQGTLLDDVQIEEIEIAVVQSPFTFAGTTYNPFISFVGDITLFGFNIDAMLTFNTKASPPYLQACGTFNQNGGPVVVSVGGVTLLKMSDTTGTKGPAMCIDTLALSTTSNFCGGACNAVSPGGSGYFLVLDAQTSILGLVSTSVFAKVATTSFDFDVKLNLFGVLGAELQCVFDPEQGDFFGAAEFSIGDQSGDTVSFPNSIDLQIGPFSVNIPLPTIEFAVCVAAGTFAPAGVSCAGWTPPSSGPFFHFGLDFQFSSIQFDIDFTIDESTFSSIAAAFDDFGQFLLNWLKDVANWGAQLLLKLLYSIGKLFEEAVQAVAQALGKAVEEIADLAKEVWNDLEAVCSETTANGLL